MSDKWYPSYNNGKVFQCNECSFSRYVSRFEIQGTILEKKVPDMSRQQVKVSGPKPKLSYIIQYCDIFWKNYREVQMNNPL